MYSNPRFHSVSGEFLESDLKEEGIVSFFNYHDCNSICYELELEIPKILKNYKTKKWVEKDIIK